MKEKGFTLIELLAVIVILAIIALIAVPIILNIIEDSKNESNQRSIDLYGTAVKNAIAKYQMANTNTDLTGKYKPTDTTGTKIKNDDNGIELPVDYDGARVYCDKIELYADGNLYITSCRVNGTEVDYEYGTKNTYKNGQVIYFDVAKGSVCKKEEYESSYGTATVSTFVYGGEQEQSYYTTSTVTDYLNSLTGYNGFNNKTNYNQTTITDKLTSQNSCLKFYVFNDTGEETVSLILDHNTTDLVAWTNDYGSGPNTALQSLQSDTTSWIGTETPTNYSIDKITVWVGYDYASYQYNIDYSSYKARLITSEEIAQITGYQNWNINQSTSYHFDTNSTTTSETCKYGNTSGCSYGWLYDRTSTDCTDYGCLNNTQTSIVAYWTATASKYVPQDLNVNTANVVSYRGYLSSNYATFGNERTGVRPVIEVLRSNLSQ